MKKLLQVGDYRSLSETCLRSESWIYVVLRHKKCRGIESVCTPRRTYTREYTYRASLEIGKQGIFQQELKNMHILRLAHNAWPNLHRKFSEFIHSFRIVHSQLMDSPFNLDMALDRRLFQWLRNSPNKKFVFYVGLVTWNSRAEIS